MEILKFGDSPSPKRSNSNGRKTGPMIVAGLLVAMMGMSTTLAGTISIGTGNRVEFGQGVVDTAACDDAITVTPTSSFSYADDTFTVSSISLSGIANACVGKDFTIKAYSGTAGTYNGSSVENSMGLMVTGQNGAAATSYIKFRIPTSNSDSATAYSLISSDAYGVSAATFSGASSYSGGSGQITINGLSINAAVTRITIESSDHS